MRSPQRPLDGWRVQHADPHYGYAWYCGEGIVISQVIVPHGSVEAARAYHDFEDAILRDRSVDMQRAGGLFVIHDWRAMESYDGEARTVWQARMRLRPKGYLKGSVVCLARANKLLHMAVQAANLVASIAHGAKVELTTDLDRALRDHRIAEPPGG